MSVLDYWIAQKHLNGGISREKLDAWQLQKLRELVAYAKERSPYYSRVLKDSSPLRSFEEFWEYPTMDADTVRTQGMKLMCVSQRDISRVVSLETSGTSSAAKRFFFTGEDQELTVDFFHYGMEELVSPGGCAAVFLPWKSPGCVGDLLIKGLERLEVNAHGMGIIENLQTAAEELVRIQADTAVGIPVQILALMEYMKSNGMKIPVKKVLLSTDCLPDAIRKRLEDEGIQVFNHFGMTECGLGAALECKAHDGMHIRENDLYMEILDDKGSPVSDGTWGELTVTTLTRKGMPLIRYRTGDIARFLPGVCSCNSVLKRLDQIPGRLREEKIFGQRMGEWDEFLFSIPGVVDFHINVEKEEINLEIDVIGAELNCIRKQIQEKLEEKGIDKCILVCREIKEKLSSYEGKRKIRRKALC